MSEEKAVDPARVEIIKGGLSKLDTTEDGDWTDSGLPNIERLKAITGLADLKRAEVGLAVPGYSRTNASAAPTNLANVTPGSGGPISDNSADKDQTAGALQAQATDTGSATADPAEIAAKYPDAILLCEALSLVAQGDAYRRNSPLQTFVRHYMVDQRAIKDHQAKLDARDADRATRNAAG